MQKPPWFSKLRSMANLLTTVQSKTERFHTKVNKLPCREFMCRSVEMSVKFLLQPQYSESLEYICGGAVFRISTSVWVTLDNPQASMGTVFTGTSFY